MLFTSLKRLQKKPKWAAIAHACGGALGAMIVRDFFPASGALCTICLKDMSHKTKFSGCATCLSFICSKCQDDMYHLHPHDVLYKEFSSTFTADLLLSDGTIKKVVDTLAENGAAVYPVNGPYEVYNASTFIALLTVFERNGSDGDIGSIAM
jgi:hypothetical protein